jgi:peptidyl-prolyl cis-trans isomerase D
MKWFHKNRKKIYLIVIAVFVVGSFAGFGSYFFDQSPLDAAVTVNGRKIPYKRFDNFYQQVLEEQRQRSPQPLTDSQRDYLNRQVVQSLVQEEVFVMEAEKLGLTVADMELAQMIQHIPAFQKEGKFDVGLYRDILGRLRLKVEDFEADQRRQLMAQKAQFIMASGIKISSLEYPAKLQAALAQASEDDRKKISENPDGFQENVRRQEMQAALQEWYNDQSTRLKVKVLLSKLEGPKANAAPAPVTP